jgi:zinc-ribbon domain
MYCGYCGTQIQEGQSFCTRCGRAVSLPVAAGGAPVQSGGALGAAAGPSAPPPAPTWAAPGGYAALPMESRLVRNVRILGILWIVGSALRMVPALGMLFLGHMRFPFMPPLARVFVVPMMGGFGALLTVASVAGIAAGWGLLERRSWARMLAVVLGCLALIDFPFGTALGIYTLWALLSAGAEAQYERLSQGRTNHEVTGSLNR